MRRKCVRRCGMADHKRIWYTVFAIYCIAMAYLLFGREEAPAGIPYADQLRLRLNLVPFRTLGLQVHMLTEFDRPWLIRHALINLLGNVVLFIPLGIFLPKLWPRLQRLWRVLLATGGIIVLVEAIQILTLLGRCDIDDLLLNLTGAAIGYGIFKWIWKE